MPHTFRILDANANRVLEGLRVVEEYVRFELDDRHLTETCKQLRHDVSTAIRRLPVSALMAARHTQGDVGTQAEAGDEYTRTSTLEICSASQKRVEQSLRCLEEYSKIEFPDVAAAFEQLRYRAYVLAKAIDLTNRSRANLADARLYLLIDGMKNPDDFQQKVKGFVHAGVSILQLRDKTLSDRELLERARALRQVTRGTATRFIMNDRADLAALADADGVHVGQCEIKVAEARAILGTGRLVGVSTHSLAEARQAVLDGADYIGCGPTFPSDTKSFPNFPGLEFLRAVAQEITLPAFAIGGIHAGNLESVLAAGMTRVAVSGGVLRAADPIGEAKKLLSILNGKSIDAAKRGTAPETPGTCGDVAD